MHAVRSARDARGWSQRELAERAGLSRTEISAIETGRSVPSATLAVRLARALSTSVEALFGDPSEASEWAWPPPAGDARYYEARVGERSWRIPCEPSLLGSSAHDRAPGAAERTLVIAGCDPAVGLLAEPLRERGVRLVSVTRSSRAALALLAAGRVHLAGLHLGGGGNLAAVRALGSRHHLLRVAIWEEGVALSAQSTRLGSARALARLRWASRAEGSGARDCMRELLEGAEPRHENIARDHREVAAAIRAGFADAGVCIRLAAVEAGLPFHAVRREAYELCHGEQLIGDRRLEALLDVLRSRELRETLADLPGYDSKSTGELRVAK